MYQRPATDRTPNDPGSCREAAWKSRGADGLPLRVKLMLCATMSDQRACLSVVADPPRWTGYDYKEAKLQQYFCTFSASLKGQAAYLTPPIQKPLGVQSAVNPCCTADKVRMWSELEVTLGISSLSGVPC